MALYKRGKNWYADLPGAGGGRHRISLKTADAKVARLKHSELELALLRGADAVRPAKVATLGEAFDYAFRMHYRGKASVETATYHKAHVLAVIPAATPLSALTRGLVDKVVARQQDKGAKASTINRTLSTLGRVLRVAQEAGLMAPLPFKLPHFAEPQGRIRVFTPEEEAAILGYFPAGDPMRPLCALLADTGLRLGEALKRDLLEPHGASAGGTASVTVWQTKNGSHRTVPLTRRAQEALAEWLAAPPLTADSVHYRWKQARAALGYAGDPQFVPHTFRHTCATRLARAGVDVAAIKLWLGHKDVDTTMVYINMTHRDLSADALEPVTCPVS